MEEKNKINWRNYATDKITRLYNALHTISKIYIDEYDYTIGENVPTLEWIYKGTRDTIQEVTDSRTRGDVIHWMQDTPNAYYYIEQVYNGINEDGDGMPLEFAELCTYAMTEEYNEHIHDDIQLIDTLLTLIHNEINK